MVELSNPTHITHVTTPELTDSLIIPSCRICGGEGSVVIEIINDSYRQVVLNESC